MTMQTPAAGTGAADLRAAVEDFLYREADLLDSWQLDAWLTLFAEDAVYEIPATDYPEGRPDQHLFILADSKDILEGRVKRLKSVNAFAESPRSRTRRFIGNVRVRREKDSLLAVAANFHIVRMRKGMTDQFIGRYDHRLEEGAGGGFLFRQRRVLLDHDALRPHGKVSIIL